MRVAFKHGGQHLMDPIRESWVHSVINPLALPTVRQQTATAQLREVSGDFWLTLIQRAGQLANTQLSFTGDEQHCAHPSVVSQAFENSGGCQRVSHFVSQCLYLTDRNALLRKDTGFAGQSEVTAHIRENEYMAFRI